MTEQSSAPLGAVRLMLLSQQPPALTLVTTVGACAEAALAAIRNLPAIADIEVGDTPDAPYIAETTVQHDMSTGLFRHDLFLAADADPAATLHQVADVVRRALADAGLACETVVAEG